MFTELHLARHGVISRALTPPDLPCPAPLPGREGHVDLRSKPCSHGTARRRVAGAIGSVPLFAPARAEEGA